MKQYNIDDWIERVDNTRTVARETFSETMRMNFSYKELTELVLILKDLKELTKENE